MVSWSVDVVAFRQHNALVQDELSERIISTRPVSRGGGLHFTALNSSFFIVVNHIEGERERERERGSKERSHFSRRSHTKQCFWSAPLSGFAEELVCWQHALPPILYSCEKWGLTVKVRVWSFSPLLVESSFSSLIIVCLSLCPRMCCCELSVCPITFVVVHQSSVGNWTCIPLLCGALLQSLIWKERTKNISVTKHFVKPSPCFNTLKYLPVLRSHFKMPFLRIFVVCHWVYPQGVLSLNMGLGWIMMPYNHQHLKWTAWVMVWGETTSQFEHFHITVWTSLVSASRPTNEEPSRLLTQNLCGVMWWVVLISDAQTKPTGCCSLHTWPIFCVICVKTGHVEIVKVRGSCIVG